MDDIVDELRTGRGITEGPMRDAWVHGKMQEAADEIKRLRAENEKLRAALRGSYEVYAGSDGFIPATAAEGYQQQIIKQMVDCISAALEGK